MAGGTRRLLLLSLVGFARGIHLSDPIPGLACEPEANGEIMELGHRQLDVTAPLKTEVSICADECGTIEGCTAFHVMQSIGCNDEVGPDVCVPWAECTFFSRCEALDSGDSEAPDWKSTTYFVTDAASPAVAATAHRRAMKAMPATSSAMMGSMMGMGSLQLPGASSLSSLSSVVEVAVSSAMMGSMMGVGSMMGMGSLQLPDASSLSSVVEVVVPVLGCPRPPPPVPPPPSPPPPLMCGPGTGVNAVSGACEIVCSAGTSRRTLEDPSAGQPLSARSIIEAFLMQQPHTMTRMEMQKALSEDQDFRQPASA